VKSLPPFFLFPLFLPGHSLRNYIMGRLFLSGLNRFKSSVTSFTGAQ